MEDIEILKEIGRGSYGSVWLVSRFSDRRLLVLKKVSIYLFIFFYVIAFSNVVILYHSAVGS